jgi:hypothetical protein
MVQRAMATAIAMQEYAIFENTVLAARAVLDDIATYAPAEFVSCASIIPWL